VMISFVSLVGIWCLPRIEQRTACLIETRTSCLDKNSVRAADVWPTPRRAVPDGASMDFGRASIQQLTAVSRRSQCSAPAPRHPLNACRLPWRELVSSFAHVRRHFYTKVKKRDSARTFREPRSRRNRLKRGSRRDADVRTVRLVHEFDSGDPTADLFRVRKVSTRRVRNPCALGKHDQAGDHARTKAGVVARRV
jgi:hypothetical protein